MSGDWLGTFTVSLSEQALRVPLALVPNVDYALLTLSFRYTPTAWSPTCYNPAAATPQGFPAFESWVALKRGTHWCKGGSLFEATLHGPAPGHGVSNQALAETYYKSAVWTGGGCGTTDIEADIYDETHSLAAGTTYDALVVLDMNAATLSADTGSDLHSGPVAAGARLIASDDANDGWYVVFSFDGGFRECYDEQGVEDPTAPCCWLPSLGWTYEDLHWEACP